MKTLALSAAALALGSTAAFAGTDTVRQFIILSPAAAPMTETVVTPAKAPDTATQQAGDTAQQQTADASASMPQPSAQQAGSGTGSAQQSADASTGANVQPKTQAAAGQAVADNTPAAQPIPQADGPQVASQQGSEAAKNGQDKLQLAEIDGYVVNDQGTLMGVVADAGAIVGSGEHKIFVPLEQVVVMPGPDGSVMTVVTQEML